MFGGYMRKVVFPLVSLVALGWLLIMTGYGIEINDLGALPIGNLRYSWYVVILLTPFMLIMAVVQAAIDKLRLVMNIIGAITTFLGAIFLTALGYLLNFYGSFIHDLYLTSSSVPTAYSLQFSGAIIAGLSWVALSCISHFYKCEHSEATTNNLELKEAPQLAKTS